MLKQSVLLFVAVVGITGCLDLHVPCKNGAKEGKNGWCACPEGTVVNDQRECVPELVPDAAVDDASVSPIVETAVDASSVPSELPDAHVPTVMEDAGGDADAQEVSSNKAISVTTGTEHSCALLANGKVKCWGSNKNGQIGNLALAHPVLKPTVVEGVPPVKAILASELLTCAITEARGTVVCWGTYGNPYYPNNPATTVPPTEVPGLAGAVDLALSKSGEIACALLDSGRVTCWRGHAAAPALVDGVTDIVDLTGEGGIFCGLRADGDVWCWGGWTDALDLILKGLDPWHLPTRRFYGVKSLAVGKLGTTLCVVLLSGRVQCMGPNNNGDLGNGAVTQKSVELVDVVGLSGVVQVAIGQSTCALLENGRVYCWGRPQALGYESTNSANPTPRLVPSLANIKSLGGHQHLCAVTKSGGVNCWGLNSEGSLGDGTTIASQTPVAVVGIGD
jgi:alpha-tubulin suppressor-like RCC1 family protein